MENTNVNTTGTEIKAKLIFNSGLAKYLVEECGQRIIGLKANRENRDRSVFVFADSLELRDSMQEYTKERRKARAERAKASAEDAVAEEVDEGPQQED